MYTVFTMLYTEGMKNRFGSRVRKRREAALPLDPSLLGLRRVAARIGVEPSYLSKVERGLVPPSERVIMRLAKVLALDPDELLALAGKIHADVRRAILKRPKLMSALVRQFAKVSDEAVMRAILRARRTGRQ